MSGASGSVPGVPLCPAKKLLRPPVIAALSQRATPTPPAVGRSASSVRGHGEESIFANNGLLGLFGLENAQFIFLVHLKFLRALKMQPIPYFKMPVATHQHDFTVRFNLSLLAQIFRNE